MPLSKIHSASLANGAVVLATIPDATITSAKLTTTGVTAGVYGNTISIPVITVDVAGRATTITTGNIPAGNSTVQGLLQIVDSVSNTSNVIAAAANSVTAAVSTASSDATTKAGTAYSNAVSTASSDATTKAGTAYSNAVAYAASNTYVNSTFLPLTGGTVSGDLTVSGNVTISGTTTTVNSTAVSIADINIELARNATTAAQADGAGLTITGPTTAATLTYSSSNDRWNLNKDLTVSNVYGNLTGAVTGNASTATTLQTTRSITTTGDGSWTVSFDGSANVTSALTLATVNSNVGTFNNVTVDAKGLVTAANNVSYLTSYTEVDTLATVTGRGATTTIASTFNGGITVKDSMSASTTNAGGNFNLFSNLTGFQSLTIAGGNLITGTDKYVYVGTGNNHASSTTTVEISSSTSGSLTKVWSPLTVVGTITGSNLSGTNTGDQTNISGTAAGETLATVTGRGATTSTLIRINNQLQVGQNTNGTAWIDAYGGFAYYGADSNSTGMKINSAGTASFTGTITASNFSGSSSGTNTGDQTNVAGYSNYVNRVTNYQWLNATLPTGYNSGLETSFVSAAEGWPNYGVVLSVMGRIPTDPGGNFQLYMGHGSSYGGLGLRVRSINQTNSAWTSWKILLDETNYTSYAMPAGSSATNSVDVRAPIFYDSGNTAYYTDPATLSVLNRLIISGGDASNANQIIQAAVYPMIDFTSDNANANNRNWRLAGVYNSYGLFQFLSSTAANGTPTTARLGIDGSSGYIGIGAAATGTANWLQIGSMGATGYSGNHIAIGNGTQAFAQYLNGATSMEFYTNAGYFNFDKYVQAAGSMRAPIFYDSDDTGYYVNPNGTSNLVGLTVANTISANISGNAGTATTLQTSRTINGTGFNGSANIDTTEWFHSDRDYPSGTLITTSINYAVNSGDPFVLEIRGNSYGNIVPLDIQYQGYIYSDTIINHGGLANGLMISGLVAINVGGNLCFWFPTQGYWNGYNVKVYTAYATRATNRVTSITGTAKPTSTKEVALTADIRQSLHSGNYTSYAMPIGSSATNSVDIRAPIFYDSNNTAYYVDPNSTTAAILAGSVGIGTTSPVNTAWGNASTTKQITIYGSDYGILNLKGDIATASHYSLGVGGTRYYAAYDNNAAIHRMTFFGNFTGFNNITTPEYNIHLSGTGYATGDWRAPIFYDSNDTAYFVDPRSNSTLSGLKLNGVDNDAAGSGSDAILWINKPNNSDWAMIVSGALDYGIDLRMAASHTYAIQAQANGTAYSRLGSDLFYHNASVRAPLFYDNNDTSYYVDAASTSVMNRISTVRTDNWLYIDNSYGHSVVGKYEASVYQGVFAMGDSYKLTAGGGVSNLYGMCWSHPNAGGAGGNLDSHGLIILINGGFASCMSYSIKASGNVTAYSDERLKTNWRDMPEDFVAKLSKVKVGIYDRIDGEKLTQVGVSAQSLQAVLPEAIITANDEISTLSISYGSAAMASAIELAKEIVMLKDKINHQDARINNLENLIAKLIEVK